ncbi:MAG: hypothetical protein JSV80_10605 [Acidobacteriota bacterium]|nr:MAG: hypothetical protein JSV80_10605 [Acidobacteriota bacterium]
MFSSSDNLATRIRRSDPEALARVASRLIPMRNDNLVERPWGGERLLAYKGLSARGGKRFGEAFEIAAFDQDAETAAHPSIARLADGSEIPLPELLAAAGPAILGADHFSRHGARIPLLPKTLEVKELLSLQTHPPGYPELYVVIEADEGATLRLGLRHDVDRTALGQRLERGRKLQEDLLRQLRRDTDQADLHAAFSEALSRGAADGDVVRGVERWARDESGHAELASGAARLLRLQREIIDLLHAIPVRAGQVIYNAVPAAREDAQRALPSAEVHALGNPEGREILLLEIRLPCRTYRAWDNIRFPLRDLETDRALDAMSERGSEPAGFVVEPQPTRGRPGMFRSVVNAAFAVDHLRPGLGAPVEEPTSERVRTLHAINGSVEISSAEGQLLGSLARGQSALVPASLAPYFVVASDESDAPEMVQVTLLS